MAYSLFISSASWMKGSRQYGKRTLVAGVCAMLVAAHPHGATAGNIGLENLLSLERLPEPKAGVQVHYVGSIDRNGGNSDWDWYLYQDENGEWVLADMDGPGCLYNFVQHRYPTSVDPIFRFYFDGEPTPRFEIKQSEFGKKYPFVAPIADRFEGDDIPPRGRGPIWVARSFVPMPFQKSLKITSSVKLEGPSKDKGQGGWGHVVYHSYATGNGVVSFTGKEDYEPLIQQWKNLGRDPKPANGNVSQKSTCTLPPGQTATLLDEQKPGSISSIELRPKLFKKEIFENVWISLYWNNERTPAVQCPLGAFFGNEFGLHPLSFITHGQRADGSLYNFFPMPYQKAGRVLLENRGSTEVGFDAEIQIKSGDRQARGNRYTFRASPYAPSTLNTPKTDSQIGWAAGRGHIVAATLSAKPNNGKYVSCEGDVRAYFDGIFSPQIQSDGSESYGGYGWGFVYPPQCNPMSGYDGYGPSTYAFSETRVLTGDWYPFQTEFTFGVEAGDRNEKPMMVHSGILFYYGDEKPGMVLSDTVDIGNEASEKGHAYEIQRQQWEGKLVSTFNRDESWNPMEETGRAFSGQSEFTVTIDPANDGVRLRRLADQAIARQRVRVYVDGTLVEERSWYWTEHNSNRRWLEDEFEIPAKYTRGKSSIRIRLVNIAGDQRPWSEFGYRVYSHLP